MYADYLKETEGYETVENEYGFVTYNISKITKILDVGDIYIKSSERNGVAFSKVYDFIRDLGVKENCVRITCNVLTYQSNPERAMYMMLRKKFKYSHFHDGVIYFYKNIAEVLAEDF